MAGGDRHGGSRSDLARRVKELGPWFHNLDLDGIRTAPDHFLGDYPAFQWRRLRPHLPQDLRDMTVLDIGCNAGYFAIEAKRLGAERVVGIDHDPRYLAHARLAAEVKGAAIELKQMSVYEIERLRERFDLVIFMGVLYHLRHPLLALDLIHEHVARDLLVCQSLERGSDERVELSDDYAFSETEIFHAGGFPKLHFVEGRYAGDPTNWWIPNRACLEAMLRSAGFAIEAHPAPEIYVCRRQSERARGADVP
jgi:tRNA (mo5U34)-methyltransferase